jgi:hypothetical protein
MRRFSAAPILAALFAVLILSILPGCSGTSAANSGVTQLILSPTSISMNTGQIASITAQPENATGGLVVADVSYVSSNPSLVTVTAGGQVCAGIWDANFINCNAVPGTAGIGSVTITATTANSVTATLPVTTHLQADRIVVNPISGCVSMGATPSYTATVYNTTAPGCSTFNPCDITSTVGTITYHSSDLQVMANNITTGVLTATNPGSTSIYASIGGLNSLPQSALVCPVASIKIHDAAGSNTSFTLAPAATQSLTADVLDTNGVSIAPILTWASNPSGSSSVTGASGAVTATVTAVAAGTATITAACSTPDCNRNVGPQYGQNVVTVTTSGASNTTVYAASTSSFSLVPIPNSTNTPGTVITLPYLPNSMVSDHAGTNLYLGSSSGVIVVATSTGTVTSTTAVPGTILAISPNDLFLLISNTSAGQVYLYSTTAKTIILAEAVTPAAAVFTADSKSVSFVVGQQLYYLTTFPAATISNLPYVPNGLDVSAQGSLTYIASAAAHAIDVRTTCNQSAQQTMAANNPTLVAQIPNGTGAVVVDSPSIDVVTTGAIGPGCPPTPQSTVNTYNLGSGSFNPRQIIFSYDSSRAWIISDLTSVISFNMSTLTPTAIPLANGAQAYSGGIIPDGSYLYVGASDNAVHSLSANSGTDSAQIAVGLKDASSNTVAPNLIAVLPK